MGCDPRHARDQQSGLNISIHAPRVGCDESDLKELSCASDFNPRTPGGVRQSVAKIKRNRGEFQSTHPGWGATRISARDGLQQAISIHAPRVGCDFTLLLGCALFIHFNPRTPGGVRLQYAWLVDRHVNISIHAPRVGCDCNIGRNFLGRRYFNPRTPGGVRLIISALHIINICISIHAPRVGCDR